MNAERITELRRLVSGKITTAGLASQVARECLDTIEHYNGLFDEHGRVRLIRAELTERSADGTMVAPVFRDLAQVFHEQFVASGAPNYLTMMVTNKPDEGPHVEYELTLRPTKGETPAAQNERLRAELAALHSLAKSEPLSEIVTARKPNLATVEDYFPTDGDDSRLVFPSNGQPWFHAASEDAERWDGPFATTEEAMKDAENHGYEEEQDGRDEDEPATYWLGLGKIANLTVMFDGERVLEDADTFLSNEDLGPDDVWADSVGCTREDELDLERRLQRAMAEWLTERRLESYIVEAVERIVLPLEVTA